MAQKQTTAPVCKNPNHKRHIIALSKGITVNHYTKGQSVIRTNQWSKSCQ